MVMFQTGPLWSSGRIKSPISKSPELISRTESLRKRGIRDRNIFGNARIFLRCTDNIGAEIDCMLREWSTIAFLAFWQYLRSTCKWEMYNGHTVGKKKMPKCCWLQGTEVVSDYWSFETRKAHIGTYRYIYLPRAIVQCDSHATTTRTYVVELA